MAGTPYYVQNPGSSDSNDGLTTGTPFLTLYKATTTMAAGDLVYAQGSEVINPAQIPSIPAGGASTHSVVYGCNSSWVVDGTRYVIDGNNAAANCIIANTNYSSIVNVEAKKATGVGILATGGAYSFIYGCYARENGGIGISAGTAHKVINCLAESNAGDGITTGRVLFSCSFNNTGRGIVATFAVGNLIYGNSGDQLESALYGVFLFNVIDGAPATKKGIYGYAGDASMFNKITNCAIGQDIRSGYATVRLGNHFANNTDDELGTIKDIIATGNAYNTLQDYVNRAAGNFRSAGSPSIFNVEIALNSLTSEFASAGLLAGSLGGGGAQLGAFETGAWR